ncbi:unnamed protein product [Didymodactylos carnosus]|uniref:TIR domain-containing protein n=1 Tax=Didymodactylos carnosus TaxID=1234261 RepID=A0A815CGP3_9BILA|nr:unnamed protein product [Didymodactylos carnosus]CAF4089469.1 unnamed protein product [Didymodactylos carnosus]
MTDINNIANEEYYTIRNSLDNIQQLSNFVNHCLNDPSLKLTLEDDTFNKLQKTENIALNLMNQWCIQNSPYKQDEYELVKSVALLNMKITMSEIELSVKCALLLDELCLKVFNNIFLHMDNFNENNLYLNNISLWLDTLAYFEHEHSSFTIVQQYFISLNRIISEFVMSGTYKNYLIKLTKTNVDNEISPKQLFYISSCSLSMGVHLYSQFDMEVVFNEKQFNLLIPSYREFIIESVKNIHQWSHNYLSCVTNILVLSTFSNCHSCTSNLIQFFQHDCAYFQALIDILHYEPIRENIVSSWSNMETILIDTIISFLMICIHGLNGDIICLLRKLSLPDICLPLIEAKFDRICITTYGILAEILTDDDLTKLVFGEHVCDVIFIFLQSAYQNSKQTYKGVPITMILKGLVSLSKNDLIQEIFSKSDEKLNLFLEMTDKYPVVYDILWAFSFNSIIKQKLKQNEIFIDKINKLRNTLNHDNVTRKMICGILWNLGYKDEDSNNGMRPIKFDIMISYSHQEKALCQSIHEQLLQRKFRVWIDYAEIYGNLMDSMAHGIETSNTILVCMSESYKRSNYCRAEAQYAFKKNLNIVPIVLQKHFKPDGWLGFLVGSLFHIDFTKYEFCRSFQMLLNELTHFTQPAIVINRELHESATIRVTIMKPSTSQTLALVDSRKEDGNGAKSIKNWTSKDVLEWCNEHKLTEFSHILNDCDGDSLYHLYEMCKSKNVEQTIALLQNEFQKVGQNLSLIDFARFLSLMAKLITEDEEIVNKNHNEKELTTRF